MRQRLPSRSVYLHLVRGVPFLEWLPGYGARHLKADLFAGLINAHGFIQAWQAQWYDGAISVITFVCTLAFAPHLDRGIMDASGQESLSLVVDRVRSAGIDISFSSIHQPVMDVLKRTHLLYKIGEDHIYPTLKQAIGAIHRQTHKGGGETTCPLTTIPTLGPNGNSKGE